MIFHGQEFLGQDPFPETIPPLDWSDAPRYVGILEPYRDLIRLRRVWYDTTRAECASPATGIATTPRARSGVRGAATGGSGTLSVTLHAR